jgi:hypothetical protein
MLHKVGLLPAGNFQQVPFAYKMYTRADDIGWEQSTEFKRAFSVDVSIEFVGVWYVNLGHTSWSETSLIDRLQGYRRLRRSHPETIAVYDLQHYRAHLPARRRPR